MCMNESLKCHVFDKIIATICKFISIKPNYIKCKRYTRSLCALICQLVHFQLAYNGTS